jgi:hypothetical protein
MSLVCPIFALLLFPALSMAQWVSVGVTGGVPLSPQSHQAAPGFTLTPADGPVAGPNDLIVKPYFVGGTVQVRLWWKFSMVAEFEYQRMHEDFTYFSVRQSDNLGVRGGASANVVLFPLLLRYDLGRKRISPFVDLGATLRNLGPFNGGAFQVEPYGPLRPANFHIAPGGNPEIAITAGAGIRMPVSLIDLAAEVRFLHWTTGFYIPVQNQAMLAVSATFPPRHR